MKHHQLKRVVAVLLVLGFASSVEGVDGGPDADAPAPHTADGTGSDGQNSATQKAAGYDVLAETVPHESLFAVAFEGERGIAVGDLGTVMLTRDGGATWTREKAPTDLALLGVALAGDRAIMVGQQGTILVREADDRWLEVDSGTEERLLNVDVNRRGTAFAVGAFGTVLRSTDAGNTWQNAAPVWTDFDTEAGGGAITGAAGEPTMNAVQVMEDGTVFLGGEIAYIVRSTDEGGSWELVYEAQAPEGGILPAVNGLRVRPDGVGFAVGQVGLVVKTIDGGATWERLDVPVEGNLHDVTSYADGSVICVGMRVAARSQDDGRTWTVLDNLDLALNWYSEIADSAETSSPIAVGHSARIITIPK